MHDLGDCGGVHVDCCHVIDEDLRCMDGWW
jgi:hypothetical protein